jgi:thiamine biosynthesis protein ThiI
VEVARRIGTYEISIQPDQDCCSLFVPKHPETRARIEMVEETESKLNVDDLLKQALRASEVLLQYPAWRANEARTVC